MKLTDPFVQLEDDRNLNKYTIAGNIACTVLDTLIKEVHANKLVHELCALGDKLIGEELESQCPQIKIKGVAFPTSVSLNNIVGHFSPNNQDKTVIKGGDLVKIELGVHIDGFPALMAYTVVCIDQNTQINTKIINPLKAVADASRKVLKVMKPGYKNTDIIDILTETAKKYECSLPLCNEDTEVAPGVISYQMSQHVIDGCDDDRLYEHVHRIIMPQINPDYDYIMMENELEENEVYAIDIVMCSSSDGKIAANLTKSSEPTIYKKKIVPVNSFTSTLKLQASKNTYKQFKTHFPINVNSYDAKFKLGLKECATKKLLDPYIPLKVKASEVVARAKFTVIVREDPLLVAGRSLSEQIDKINKHQPFQKN
jgi:curved DNA binding protein